MTVKEFPTVITSQSFLEFLSQFEDDQPELKRMVKRLEGSLWEYDNGKGLKYLRFGWRAYCSPKQSRCLISPILDSDTVRNPIAIRLHKFDGVLKELKSITFKDDDTMLVEYMDGNMRLASSKRGRR